MDYKEFCKRRPAMPEYVVEHPRYGSRPRPSKVVVPPSTYIGNLWSERKCFPDTAIKADVLKIRRPHDLIEVFYFDVLMECVECRLPFIFFAIEQKHWFEELGFSLDSWCIRCPECRKDARRLRRLQATYSELSIRDDLSHKEFVALLESAVTLAQHGILKNKSKLLRIRKQAQIQAPQHQATQALEALAKVARV